MLVETYEIEPQSNEISTLAAEGEAAMLIEQLGLEGQKKFMNPETKAFFPYRVMTKQEQLVYSTVFPERSELKEYSSDIIPVRVLQVAAHVRSLDLPGLNYLEVWHPVDAKEDPLLVARTGRYAGGQIFMCARWGTALLSFEELKVKARAILTAKHKATLARIKHELALAEHIGETMLDVALETGEYNAPIAYHLA